MGAYKFTVADEASGFSPFLPINRILYQSVFSRLLRNSTPNFVHPLVGPSCFTFLCFAVFCPTSPAVVNLRDWVNCVSSLVNWVTILNVTNHGVFLFPERRGQSELFVSVVQNEFCWFLGAPSKKGAVCQSVVGHAQVENCRKCLKSLKNSTRASFMLLVISIFIIFSYG